MRLAAALVSLCALACHDRRAAAPAPPSAPDAAVDADDDLGLGSAGGDPDEAPEDERIAAVEHAMNELAPVAHQCWAVAATDDLRLAGAVRAVVEIGHGGARVVVSVDEPRDPVLTACLVEVLQAYPWASPLVGQTIELPFAFRAPAMQNLIDRRMVAHRAQAGLDVAVLLDERNTGNPAVAVLDVRAEASRGVGPRRPPSFELWRLTTAATWSDGPRRTAVAAGDLLLVPAGASLTLASVDGAPLGATVAIAPGGPMGTARAGALPEALPSQVPTKPPAIRHVVAAGARRYALPTGAATIQVETAPLAATVLELAAGATVPPHVHARETEVLYVLGGGGTMTVGGVTLAVESTAVIQIPAGVEHSFTAAAATTAFQLYSPPGPEQRFKKK